MNLDKLAAAAATLVAPAMSEDNELHVDGDYAAYYYSGTDSTDLGAARYNMQSAIRNLCSLTGCGKVYLHLTHASSHKGLRYKAATVKPYQGQRDGGRKPKNWYGMRTWLEGGAAGSGAEVLIWEDREADDGVAHSAAAALGRGTTPYILSRDKDFRMFAGKHIIWTTHEIVDVPEGTFEIVGPDGETYGHKWFWLQMLQGDTADNIPGLPGYYRKASKAGGKVSKVGAATAAKLLATAKNNEDALHIVRSLYHNYYGEEWADRLVEQATLLWMRVDIGASPDNFKTIMQDLDPASCARLMERLTT